MKEVKDYAFAWSPVLTRIHVPASVTKIGSRSFYSWENTGRQVIYCSPNSKAYEYALANNFLIELE